jgi:S1-C subfamily serine protease
VEAQSAADQAGMLLGDVIIAINHEPIESVQQIQTYLGPQSVGQTLTLKVLRGGQLQELAVIVGER